MPEEVKKGDRFRGRSGTVYVVTEVFGSRVALESDYTQRQAYAVKQQMIVCADILIPPGWTRLGDRDANEEAV